MKFTFIKKHGINLIISICILLLIVITCVGIYDFVIYNINKPRREVFDDIKDTDYLAPVKEIISDDLWTLLTNKMNEENPDLQIRAEKLKEYTGFLTKEEINYYLFNNKFPWSTYVTTRFKKVLTTPSADSNTESNETTKDINPDEMVDKLMKNFPNRYAYKQYVTSAAMTDSLSSDIYRIYSGEKAGPVDNLQKLKNSK